MATSRRSGDRDDRVRSDHRRLLVSSLALGAAALLLILGYSLRDEILQWWLDVPVVRTWGDLLRLEPIVLEDGNSVRLGIEATRAPRGSGVLLYCLAEDGGVFAVRGGGAALGPLEVSVNREGQAAQQEKTLHAFSAGAGGAGPVLYVTAVHVPEAERYRVRVLDRGGREILRVPVRGTSDWHHPWTSFDAPSSPARLRQGGGAVGRVRVSGAGPALPKWDGMASLPPAEVVAGKADSKRRLPSLATFRPRPQLDVTYEGGDLVVTAKEKISTWGVTEHFLARWWVNGVPHVPDSRQEVRQLRELTGKRLDATSRRLRLELEFPPGALGARPGDRIAVQLLYADVGTEPLRRREGVAREFRRLLNTFQTRVLLSNRVEFVLP